MAACKLREAIGAVKDQTSVGLAKIVSSSSISDLEVAIVKATRHSENPPNPSYISEILSKTCYSDAMVQACVGLIARRLNRTKNWVVALKSLMLAQRLLAKGSIAFAHEIYFNTRRGTRFLNMCDFRDSSSRNGWDYSEFVRVYALYLDEALEFKMQSIAEKGKDSNEEEKCGEGGKPSKAIVVRDTPAAEMENEDMFFRADNLMQLLERFLASRPAGAAKHNKIVIVAIYPILKESFQIYYYLTEILGALIDRFMQMDVPDMEQVRNIFCRASKQYDQLYCFYNWCKTVGIMRFPDYPVVEKISQPKLDMMNDFIRQKSAVMHSRKNSSSPKPREATTEPAKAPEGLVVEQMIDEIKQQVKRTQEEGDLLNMYNEEAKTEDIEDRLALALFDGYKKSASSLASTIPPWEAFKDSSSGDWETALVKSASHLSNQNPSLPLDAMTLDGMYNDPFAASVALTPPGYVQMSELEKKQNLLLQEQLLWQQYVRDGMHGQVGIASLQQQNSCQYIPSMVNFQLQHRSKSEEKTLQILISESKYQLDKNQHSRIYSFLPRGFKIVF